MAMRALACRLAMGLLSGAAAVAEIAAIARTDTSLAGEGAVLLLEKVPGRSRD